MRRTLQSGVVQVVDEGPAASTGDVAVQAPARMERVGLTALSHPEMLAATGLSEALFAHWSRQKRRLALQQRVGEDFGIGADSVPEVTLWQDSL